MGGFRGKVGRREARAAASNVVKEKLGEEGSEEKVAQLRLGAEEVEVEVGEEMGVV